MIEEMPSTPRDEEKKSLDKVPVIKPFIKVTYEESSQQSIEEFKKRLNVIGPVAGMVLLSASAAGVFAKASMLSNGDNREQMNALIEKSNAELFNKIQEGPAELSFQGDTVKIKQGEHTWNLMKKDLPQDFVDQLKKDNPEQSAFLDSVNKEGGVKVITIPKAQE
jgi:hypothetical protein